MTNPISSDPTSTTAAPSQPSTGTASFTARAALEKAAEDLLEGRVPGPLTGLRLAEVAGVKRHRLTHDNPDINAEFQDRARVLNRHKPEIDRLRTTLEAEQARATRLARENAILTTRLHNYAAAILALTDERDRLRTFAENTANLSRLHPPGTKA